MNEIEIKKLPEFERDLKKLKKKYLTIEDDLGIFLDTAIPMFLMGEAPDMPRIAGLGIEYPMIFKARKFACRSLKGRGGRSGIRLVFAHFPTEKRIELVEIYYKGDSENEDRERIREYYKIS